jgi:hypothetical protein
MRRKIKHLMERAGIAKTGMAIAYIKEGLREINLLHETHLKNEKIDITQDQRFYTIPNEAIKVTDIKIKNHLNSKGDYRSIPRLIYEPHIEDGDDS